jgi:hypothetical protein
VGDGLNIAAPLEGIAKPGAYLQNIVGAVIQITRRK